jgi:hypothetical protein
MEKDKFKLELISKEIDLIHKKILVLLGAVAGSWFYSIEFAKSDIIYLNILSLILIVVFALFIMGIASNYLMLSKLQKEIKDLKGENL